VLRDLKRINSHLSAVAYPILEAAGQLRSPLRRNKSNENRLHRLDEKTKPSTN
jgi:phosphate:Na+ symporter